MYTELHLLLKRSASRIMMLMDNPAAMSEISREQKVLLLYVKQLHIKSILVSTKKNFKSNLLAPNSITTHGDRPLHQTVFN